MSYPKRAEIIAELQKDILRLQKLNQLNNNVLDSLLGPLKEAFPNASFPTGAVHEFVSSTPENAAVTSGFVSGLLASLLGNGGTALWISTSRTLFPPALLNFGLQPDRFVFVDLKKEKDVIWAMDEALKCSALVAVVGELRELSFTESRRLQLAVEQSKVTGFVLRKHYYRANTTACVSRWRITSLPSFKTEVDEELPGIGFPTWRVELLRIRNGRAGVWDFRWVNGRFEPVYKFPFVTQEQRQKAG